MQSKKMLLAFANWVAKEVCNDNFDDCPGAFAELACRKLYYMGIVSADNDKWAVDKRTNGDAIRTMSDEELSNIICCQNNKSGDECFEWPDCNSCTLEWLKQEIANDN